MAMAIAHDDLGRHLFWTCWICGAAGGYDHNSTNAYAGDVSQLHFSDREFLSHKLKNACVEVWELAHGERLSGSQSVSAASAEMSLKDLVRGKDLETLRGCVTGFAVFRIEKFFETAMQPLEPEEQVTTLA